MTKERKIYTLISDNDDIHTIKREYILEDILYRLNMVYEYVDELEDLAYEIINNLDTLIEKSKKKES